MPLRLKIERKRKELTKPEFYIIVDIEASGPDPCQYALLSIGAATIHKPQETFYIEIKPDSPNFIKEAMDINNLSLEELAKTGSTPKKSLQTFEDWIKKTHPMEQFPPSLRSTLHLIGCS